MVERLIANDGAGGMSPADFKALMSNGGNGLGENGGLTWLFLLLLFGGTNGGFGRNNNGQELNTLLRAIDGSDADVRLLANQFNTTSDAVMQALCGIQNGITQQTGMIVSSSKDIQNSILSGNCQLSAQLAQCCCDAKLQAAENRLGMCEQTNTLQAAATQNRFDTQNGFQNLSFQGQQQTQQIIDVTREEGRATRALINDNTMQALRDQNAELRLAASQSQQNETLENFIRTCVGCCGGANPVPNPQPKTVMKPSKV